MRGTYVCVVCMYVCMNEGHVRVYVCAVYACMHVCMYAPVYVCEVILYVRMYMYVCAVCMST